MGLRDEKRERMRREILDAAVVLFRERGFDTTRVRDIIDRARVSEATFFNYFPAEPGATAKETLLQQLALESVDLYAVLLRHEMARTDVGVPDRIRELCQVIAAAYAADPELQRIVITRTNVFFGATGAIRAKDLDSYELLASLFREGQRRGELRDDVEPLQLAEMLTGIFTITVTNCIVGFLGGTPKHLESRLAQAVEVFLRGCAPQ